MRRFQVLARRSLRSRARYWSPCLARPASRACRWRSDAAPPQGEDPLAHLPALPVTDPQMGCMQELEALGGLHFRMDLFRNIYQKYGDLVRMQVGGRDDVVVFHPDDIQTVFQKEGQFPSGAASAVAILRTWFGGFEGDNVAMARGPKWRQLRNALQKHLFNPRDAASHITNMWPAIKEGTEVIADYAKKMDEFTPLLTTEEMGYFLFNRPLYALRPGSSEAERTKVFVENSLTAFKVMDKAFFLVEQHPDFEPVRKEFFALMEPVRDTGLLLIREVLQRLEDGDASAKECYTALMLSREDVTENQMNENVAGFLFAGVDTSSNTMQFFLSNVAGNPEAQAKIRAEFRGLVGRGGELKPEHIPKLRYTRACLKETFRMRPTVLGVQRELDEPVELQGHTIPANTSFVLVPYPYAVHPEVFEDPEAFKPERWERDAKVARKGDGNPLHDHPYTVSQFGKGVRMCLGSRLAEVGLLSAMGSFVDRWEIGLANPDVEYKIVTATTNKLMPTPEYTFKDAP